MTEEISVLPVYIGWDAREVAAALIPSTKVLPDGRNSHLILQTVEWWEEQITSAGFKLVQKKDPQQVQGMVWWLVE